MKLLKYIGIVASMFFLTNTHSFAADTVTVDPGLGTLEAAILANGGDVVYKLTAGGWYGSEGIIEVNETLLGAGKELVIVGESTTGMPAIIQVGSAADGSVFPSIFDVYSNLTLKNLFLAAQDLDAAMGAGIMRLYADVRLIVDNCVIDPVGVNYFAEGDAPANGSKIYVTNSLMLRNGHMQGPNDGGIFMGQMRCDTIFFENNTIVSSGQDFIAGGFHVTPANQFIWINHNTFLWHDVWVKKSYNDKNFFFTNNLLHDFSIFSQLYVWGQFFPDYTPDGNRLLSLVSFDTAYTVDGEGDVTNEVLPSDRKMFWEYNLQYNSPELKSIPQYAADNDQGPLYLIPMLWNEDTPADYAPGVTIETPADSSREAQILADKTNWPYVHFNNNHYDIDPGYVDDMIYSMNDSMYQNVINWYKSLIFGETGLPSMSEVPSYMWDVDKWEGNPTNQYPMEWPRFDGSYTNPVLLTASIEGLPLGDLNWFPTQKAKWMSERSQIENHILAMNEEQYVITTGLEKQNVSQMIDIYPNPANDMLQVSSDKSIKSVTAYDIAGKKVMEVAFDNLLQKSIDISGLREGMYIIKVMTGTDNVYSAKFMKQ